ncbi:MAG: hypothetical protein A2086_06860 [Spirochaetes bacterium GWD1_27_9]|nr:MAG: hypothetical protein A2Z98_18650 [Spirochaetes bacterium GWB1_27_13]OHD20241.1 MAG: hypothetical protein A2Y34_04890 [Spirochaetes bacterium GWC1_27_15]OHD42615.1 MAG: hypothetical protein A2086_06860 [Spirochaetes bacterium GWD1_27_9]
MKKIVLFILIFIILSFFIIFVVILNDNKLEIKQTSTVIYANSNNFAFFEIKYKNKLRQKFFPFDKKFKINYIEGKQLIEEIKSKKGFYLKSKTVSGVVKFNIEAENQIKFCEIKIAENYTDSDGDGFPDVVELTNEDRDNFANWFVSIAESQFYGISSNWEAINQSCSGLVVFACKEALKKHNNQWFAKYSFIVTKNIDDVKKYNYPDVPLLKENIFRVKKGSFNINDVSSCFANTANVNNLLNFNFTFIGKNKIDFKKGDVLFYNVSNNQDSPYHSMIYTGESDYLIYHTGNLSSTNIGEVRKVKFDDLSKHPDSFWHPVSDNKSFLGAYRWNFLN